MSTTRKQKNVKRDRMPTLEAEDVIDVQFSRDELSNLITLMSVMSQTFEALAKESLKANQVDAYEVLSARAQLSSGYAIKLSALIRMGEVQSREIH